MNYDFRANVVTEVTTSNYIKEMVGFKIIKIVANESLDACMLIEHDCLC